MIPNLTMIQTKLFKQSPIAWKPHAYQLKAVRFILKNSGAGLLLDPGLGKTSVVLAAIRALKKAGVFQAALVIAPLRPCYQVWPKEVTKWAEFKDLKIEVLHGPKKDEALARKADIYVINPDGLPWLLGKNLRKIKPCTLVIDESTQFKHTDSARFKALKSYLDKFSRRWILTGTPSPNGLEDLFGQIFIIDLGRAFGPYITNYRRRFFAPTGHEGYTWKIKGEKEEKEIYRLIKPITLRLDAEDYIDMPTLLGWDAPIFVELPPKARKIYDDMEEIMIAELEEGQYATAINAGSALKKCEQIANGGLYHPDFEALEEAERTGDYSKKIKRLWTNLHNEKIDAVDELLESIQGHQALVVYDFHHDLDRLLAKLGKDTPRIGAGVSMKKGDEIETLWNAQRISKLLVHPQSVGHGLNMQTGGDYIIWHSLTWNYEHWDQLNRRLRRQGSIHKHIFAYPIIARDTVDEAKYAALNAKKKSQYSLLDALRVYVKSRRRK